MATDLKLPRRADRLAPRFDVADALRRWQVGILPRANWRYAMLGRSKTARPHLMVGTPIGVGEWFTACKRPTIWAYTTDEIERREFDGIVGLTETLCKWCSRELDATRFPATIGKPRTAEQVIGAIARLTAVDEVGRRLALQQINPEGVILAEVHAAAVAFFLSRGGKT